MRDSGFPSLDSEWEMIIGSQKKALVCWLPEMGNGMSIFTPISLASILTHVNKDLEADGMVESGIV